MGLAEVILVLRLVEISARLLRVALESGINPALFKGDIAGLRSIVIALKLEDMLPNLHTPTAEELAEAAKDE